MALTPSAVTVRLFTRRSLLSTGLCAVTMPVFMPSAALAGQPVATEPEDWADKIAAAASLAAKRKINLAGRQRMLSQRMAKAAALVRLGIEPEHHMSMMRSAHDLFARTLTGLVAGDEELGLTQERTPRVLTSLNAVEALWDGYGAAIRAALDAGTVDDAALAEIARLNGPVLVAMNSSVSNFEQAYGDLSIPLGLAIAINVSGRQRMLSQKMSKEACLCALGLDAEANRAALADTVQLFDLSLMALTEGLPTVSIIKPPTPAIAAKLAEVAGLWATFKPAAQAVAAATTPDPADIALIAARNDALLDAMNDTVWLYENV